MSDIRVGLVLSGGGAKGAYHVGVMKALYELGARVDAVAGASIGALNGAILASAPSFQEGVGRLEELWGGLAESSPLSLKMPNYLELLAVAGLRLNGLSYIHGLESLARATCGSKLPGWLNEWLEVSEGLSSGVLSDTPLQRLMNRYLDVEALANGLPLYISVFRSQGALKDLLSCVIGELGFSDSPDSEFLHVQSLRKEEQKEALLASAAIPLLFAPKKVNGTSYTDGGQGGWSKMQGNTPIAPLVQAGYKNVIVTHLSDGSLWSRQDFSDTNIIEIRPQISIDRDGGARDLLGFDAKKIPSWIQQGYDDTVHCVGRIMKASGSRTELRTSEDALAKSTTVFKQLDQDLDAAMARLKTTT